MEIRRTVPSRAESESPLAGQYPRTYVFFTVPFNRYRVVGDSNAHEVLDRYEPAECECVLCLPHTYTDDGEETQLVLSCHGAGSTVRESEDRIGGVKYASRCVDEGFAVLDISGAEPHGLTMGCPEHIFALHRAYRYAVKHFHLTQRVLVAGASMGGHTAMNFANTFPGITAALGLIYPRLNMDGVTVDGHYCVGTWDKVNTVAADGVSTHDRVRQIYRFPHNEWCEENTVGFNPYRTRSFVNSEGERVVIPPCPIKVWQGLADQTVDPVMVEKFVRSVRRSGSYAELHLLEGVGHKITPVMQEELNLWFDRFR